MASPSEKATDVVSEDTSEHSTRSTLKDGVPHYAGLAGKSGPQMQLLRKLIVIQAIP